MGLSVGSQILKLILFIFNFLWLLFGLAIVVVGSLIYNESDLFNESLKNFDMPTFSIFLIAVGIVTIIISFCGCCGAIQESQCMTVTYSVFLFIIIVIEVTITIIIFVKLKETSVESEITKHIQGIFSDENLKRDVNTLQSKLKCCGPTGPGHYTTIPESCCPDEKPCNKEEAFQDGCVQGLMKFVDKHKKTLGFSALGFAIVEFLAFVFSCILAKNMD